MKLQAPKGTKDIYFEESKAWQFVEEMAKQTFEQANFSEIRTPSFEYTQLFSRGVGESTDIVNKEMYSFTMSDRSFTLRPEGTAGVVRAYIQNGFHRKPSPQKLWYKGPMFRYERPQAGRQRQFHQIGAELFGSASPAADAEVIILALRFISKLGIPNLELNLNNIGCPECRQAFKDRIKESVKDKLDQLCQDCNRRYTVNPMRMLDCKVEKCQEIYAQEPTASIVEGDFICEKCKTDFDELIEILNSFNVPYKMNKKLVRGLDYYNGAVFEITSNALGSQNAVCGGGRYDGLVELLGGPKTPAVGWAVGVERLVSLIDYQVQDTLDAYIISDDLKAAIKLADILRDKNKKADFSHTKGKFGKQIERASKMGASHVIILGSDELEKSVYTVKNLESGEQKTCDLDTLLTII